VIIATFYIITSVATLPRCILEQIFRTHTMYLCINYKVRLFVVIGISTCGTSCGWRARICRPDMAAGRPWTPRHRKLVAVGGTSGGSVYLN